jgi:hypothetical protein
VREEAVARLWIVFRAVLEDLRRAGDRGDRPEDLVRRVDREVLPRPPTPKTARDVLDDKAREHLVPVDGAGDRERAVADAHRLLAQDAVPEELARQL